MIDEIINIKELKRYIKQNYGTKCTEEFEWECPVCKVWNKYEQIESFVKDNRTFENSDKKNNVSN